MKTEKYEVIREYWDNGQLYYEEYKLEGKLHNPNGPACRLGYNNGQLECEAYWNEDKRHNTTGPAYRHWDKNGQLDCKEYYLEGKQLTKEQFENRKNDCVANKVVEIDGKKYKLINIDTDKH